MDSLTNRRTQILSVFSLLVTLVALQTVFPFKGTSYFLVLPSIFLLVTYKPDLIGYGVCFAVGILNDLFAMQVLGISSVLFLGVRFLKLFLSSNLVKNDQALLVEYVSFSFCLSLVVYILMLLFGMASFNLVFLISFLSFQVLGYLICRFLWLKIFEIMGM